MLRNDSPRISNKMFEILKEIITNKVSLNKFSNEFLEMLNAQEESHVLTILFSLHSHISVFLTNYL